MDTRLEYLSSSNVCICCALDWARFCLRRCIRQNKIMEWKTKIVELECKFLESKPGENLCYRHLYEYEKHLPLMEGFKCNSRK